MNNPIEDYIIRFVVRKESQEDVQKLKEWLVADPAHRDELKEWLVAWDIAGMLDAAEKFSADKAYQRFMFRVNAETAPKMLRKNVVFTTIRRIAVIFVVSFSLGMLYYYWTKNQPEKNAFIEKIAPLGSKSEIQLPDGGTVWLNAGSSLRYHDNYGKTKRDIYLEGEGYFIVARQSGKPFTVYTALANITALGTEFNVKAYTDEDRVETILISGEITVENGEAIGAFERTILKPWQKLSVSVSDSLPVLVITQLDPDIAEAEVSWKERYWRLERVPMKDLAVKLERRYDVLIQVDDRLKDYPFSGTFGDESLEQVLHAIQSSAPIPILYDIDGKNVFIRKE